MNFYKYMKYHLSNGTIVFVVSLQTKKLHAILTFCPIFVLMSHCALIGLQSNPEARYGSSFGGFDHLEWWDMAR